MPTFAASNQTEPMFKQPKTQQRIIRFRRWSRARYAVFCSLGVVVTIGSLGVSIADKSVQKSTRANTLSFISLAKEGVDNDSADLENEFAFQFAEAINLTSATTDEAAARITYLNIHPNG